LGQWRRLYTEPLDGIDNMALDHALLARAARTGESVLRVYSWRTPTVSFGRHQHTAGVYTPETLAAHHLHAVRRPTGGRALLHFREATYSVTAPITSSLRAAYASINTLLIKALHALGVPATLAAATATRAPRPDTTPCFAVPVEGEITLEGRKLAGSAQRREGHAFLQHGSILIENDQSLLPGVHLTPPATLHEALGRCPTVEEIAAALFASLDATATPLSLEELDDSTLAALREHYSDEHWTWRA
jgi:lipoate-protein ligase A